MSQRYSDRDNALSRHHISTLAFVLAGLLIAVTSISLTFVGYVASHASSQQAIENEQRLFRNALENNKNLIIHEQLNMSRWDESVRRIVLKFDYEFVRNQIRALWTNYRHSKVLIVAGNNQVLAESFQDYTHIMNRPITETPGYIPLIDKARALYMTNRVRVPGGYSHCSIQGLQPSDYAAIGFAQIDGRPALVGAMPIIPDQDKATLPDGQPFILVSVKFIDETMLATLNTHLSFTNLAFSDVSADGPDSPTHFIRDIAGNPLGSFTWQSQAQGSSIWPTVIPVILVLSLLLAALAFGIAWRIGRLTSSLQASEYQNRYLALHDTLSGLANRLQFGRGLQDAVQELPDKPFAIIHCDLDRFKTVNDTYGHSAGDTVIKAVAQRMQDIIGSGGLVARLGGDEFVILYRASTDYGRLTKLCNQLISAIETPIQLGNGSTAEVGMSIGIVTAPECGADPKTLMAAADDALYSSKENGRGQAAFADDMKPFLSLAAQFARELQIDSDDAAWTADLPNPADAPPARAS